MKIIRRRAKIKRRRRRRKKKSEEIKTSSPTNPYTKNIGFLFFFRIFFKTSSPTNPYTKIIGFLNLTNVRFFKKCFLLYYSQCLCFVAGCLLLLAFKCKTPYLRLLCFPNAGKSCSLNMLISDFTSIAEKLARETQISGHAHSQGIWVNFEYHLDPLQYQDDLAITKKHYIFHIFESVDRQHKNTSFWLAFRGAWPSIETYGGGVTRWRF